MRRRKALDPVERFAPGGFGLAGEPGDQVDVVVVDAGVAQGARLPSATICGGVLAAGAADFGLDEGLDAEADAIDAGGGPGAGFLDA